MTSRVTATRQQSECWRFVSTDPQQRPTSSYPTDTMSGIMREDFMKPKFALANVLASLSSGAGPKQNCAEGDMRRKGRNKAGRRKRVQRCFTHIRHNSVYHGRVCTEVVCVCWCVCWCVCDVCMVYSCGLELHIGFFGEGGHLCKSLEVPFSLWRMFMCTLMCVCAHVWGVCHFLPYKALCSLSRRAFTLLLLVGESRCNQRNQRACHLIAETGVAQLPACQYVSVSIATFQQFKVTAGSESTEAAWNLNLVIS